MELDKILRSGDEIRIKTEEGSFITTIHEITGEDTFTILDWKEMAKPGGKCQVSCVTERGLYMFETSVSMKNLPQAVIGLRATGGIKKIQRREAFRVRESVEVRIRRKPREAEPAGEWLDANTVDISETGTLLRCDESCAQGQVLELIIRMNRFGMDETLSGLEGKVVRSLETGNKKHKYLLGVRFEVLPEKARNKIIRLAVLSQRSKLAYRQIKRYK